jgi:transposase
MVRKRPRVEPTEDFQQILPLCWWPEQVEYERMRQPVLFGSSVAERARETGVSESTLRRRIGRFEDEGMEGLFATEKAKRRKLPTNIRRLIVDLKAEYPPFNLNEIANIVGACFGRKPDVRSVKRVLDEEALPLKLERSYPRYHEMEAASPGQGRAAVVELRVDGWSAKAIAGHLGMGRSTVYKVLGRFKEEGAEGLADKPYGRPVGVRKVTLAAIEEVRKLARNPQIGAFRVHAALKQNGFDLSRTTCGRILAQVREIYGYDTPKSGGGSKKAMPFASERHHQYWTADVRYLDMLGEELLAEGMVYAVTIMENYSRAMLASSVTRRQDLNAFLDVLYRAGYRNMVRPRRSSPTLAPSFWPIGRRPSTGLWASASWRSRGDNPGRATWKQLGVSRGGWPTTTSQKPQTGAGCSKSTIGGYATTTSRSTTPTSTARKADVRPPRCSLGSRRYATRRKTSPGRSSRSATRVSSTTSAISPPNASGFTPRRGSPGQR